MIFNYNKLTGIFHKDCTFLILESLISSFYMKWLVLELLICSVIDVPSDFNQKFSIGLLSNKDN